MRRPQRLKLHSLAALWLSTLATPGCKWPTQAPRTDASVAAQQAPSIAPMQKAMAFTLSTALSLPEAATFTRLAPPHRHALESLLATSTLPTRVFSAEGRLLILPPKNHPAAGLALLFDTAEDRLDVRLPEGRVVRLPARALLDVLDRALPSKRGLGEDPMHGGLPQLKIEELPMGPALRERWRIDAPLRYQRRDLGTVWSLRLRVALDAVTRATVNEARISPLCPLILPLLLGVDDALLGLEICPAEALSWRFVLDNSDRESAASARFVTRVERHGWQSLGKEIGLFNGRVSAAWRLPGPEKPGAQFLDAEALTKLRPAGPRGDLTVDNRSGVAALIYIDGALLGWVASSRQMHFIGLPHGFFQVFATAPSGVRAWGPKAFYSPGTLTLN